MLKSVRLKNILIWLKLFTYVSAAALLVTNNPFDQLTYLIPLLLLLFTIDYFREYGITAEKKNYVMYLWTSIILELLLIVSIGFLDKSHTNILLFYVFISSLVIAYPFLNSVPIAIFYILSGLLAQAYHNGYTDLLEIVNTLIYSYGISTTFVMGMSYLVKSQIREKEKLGRINTELEEAYKRLIDNSAAAHQLTIEEERTRIAREIHDTLAHTLTSLIVQLEACKRLSLVDPTRLPEELDKAQALSRSGFNDIKRSIKALRPVAMEDKSFVASINSIIFNAAENTDVKIEFEYLVPQDVSIPHQLEIALFRAIQESITNSIRHGQATAIIISVKCEESVFLLSIEDNGTGCSFIKKGYGLNGMTERIEGLKGKVQFASASSKGFNTIISIPIKRCCK